MSEQFFSNDVSLSLANSIYIVNYENNGGFSIICADNRSEQIIAFAESGNIPTEALLEETKSGIYSNDGNYTIYDIIGLLPYYVESLSQYLIPWPDNLNMVDSLSSDGYYFCNPTFYNSEWIPVQESDDIYTWAVWNQNSPYNYYSQIASGGIPIKYPVGCNALAIGQLMRSFSSPYSFKRQKGELAGTTAVIPWANHYYSLNEDAKTISDFLIQIANRLPTTFGTVSTANPNNIPSVLAHYHYSCNSISNYNYENIVSSIDTYHGPVIIWGYPNDSETDGHTWLLGGYKTMVKYYLCEWDVYGPGMVYAGKWSSMLAGNNSETYAKYVYCNWGWDGDYNGYYLSGLFSPNNNDFTHKIKILTGIHPNYNN